MFYTSTVILKVVGVVWFFCLNNLFYYTYPSTCRGTLYQYHDCDDYVRERERERERERQRHSGISTKMVISV